jgi:hypothetical protein
MKLRSWQLATIIILLYLAIPFIGYGLLGTMVTDKYQIEHARIFVDIYSDKMTDEEQTEELKRIDEQEKELRLTQYTLIGLAAIFLLTATGLLINSNKIIKKAAQQRL